MTTRVSVTANGTADTFSVPFPYIDSSHVKVLLDGVETSAYSWATSSSIQFDSLPAAGAEVYIYRDTPADPLVAFARGSVLPLADLETDSRQALYRLEEIYERGVFLANTPASSAVDSTLPEPAALDLIGWSEDGRGMRNFSPAELFTATTAGVSHQYAVLAGTTTLDVSDIVTPFGVGSLFYNGIFQDPSAYSVASGTLTFTEALPADGTVTIVAVFRSADQITDDDQLFHTSAAVGGVTRSIRAKLGDTLSVKDFGAVGDGVTDDTVAIQAAVAAAAGQQLYFPAGSYLYSSEIVLDTAGSSLIGAGRSGHYGTGEPGGATVGGASRLIAAHTTGAAIRIKHNDCTVKDLTVDASAARSATVIGDNHGIHVEGADASGASAIRSAIKRVRVTNQPGHGVVMVDNIVASRLEMTGADNCGGHGFLITGGSYSGRTNRTRPGQVQLDNCWASRTGGHGLLVGVEGEVDASDFPYRIEVNNFEAFYNASDAAVRQAECGVYVSGENIMFTSSASAGYELATGDDVMTTLRVRGKNVSFFNHRAIMGNPYAVYVEDHPIAQTRGVLFQDLFVSNANQASGFYNPAVFIESGCEYVTVKTGYREPVVASLASTGATRTHIENNGNIDTTWVNTRRIVAPSGVVASATELVLNDDTAGYIEFSGPARGVLTIVGNTASAGAAVIAYRCGDGSAYATLLSSGGVTVEVGTGALAGTTGTDVRLNVRADTASNRLYIENRLGGQKSYSYALSGVTNVTASAAVAL